MRGQPPPGDIPKPDWNLWSQKIDAKVKAAVALSCDIDPDVILGVVIIDDARFDEFDRRREIVQNHIDTRLVRISRRTESNRLTVFIRLLELRALAEKLGWALPEGYPKPPVVLPGAPSHRPQPPVTDPIPIPAADEAGPGSPLARPDWSMWSQRLEAVITDATALSCDIDPEELRRGVKGDLLKEYFRRGDITRDRMLCGELPVVQRPWGINPAVNYVRLTDYAKMAIGLGWPLPAEFPRLADTQAAPAVPGTAEPVVQAAAPENEKPLTTKERTSLLVIIVALADKAGIDISRPTTAAKEIVRLAAALKLKLAVGTVEKYLKEAEDAQARKAFPEPDLE